MKVNPCLIEIGKVQQFLQGILCTLLPPGFDLMNGMLFLSNTLRPYLQTSLC